MIAEAALAALAFTSPACTDPVAKQLHAVGFRGERLKTAWAIVMRESKGHAIAVSLGGDYGLFQFNRSAYSGASWWDPVRLLDPAYNATVAFNISQGGRTFYPWDIGGRRQHLARYSSAATFRVFVQYLGRFPCR